MTVTRDERLLVQNGLSFNGRPVYLPVSQSSKTQTLKHRLLTSTQLDDVAMTLKVGVSFNRRPLRHCNFETLVSLRRRCNVVILTLCVLTEDCQNGCLQWR